MIYIVEEIHHVGVGIVHHTLIIIRQHVYQQIFDHILATGRLEFHAHAKTHVVHVKHVVRVIAERSGLGLNLENLLKELFVRSGRIHFRCSGLLIDHILRIGVQFTYGQRRNAVRNRRFDAGRKDDRCRRGLLGIGLGRRQVSNFCQISGSHLQFDCRILCFKELHFQ